MRTLFLRCKGMTIPAFCQENPRFFCKKFSSCLSGEQGVKFRRTHGEVLRDARKNYFHDVKINFQIMKINFQSVKINFHVMKITFRRVLRGFPSQCGMFPEAADDLSATGQTRASACVNPQRKRKSWANDCVCWK